MEIVVHGFEFGVVGGRREGDLVLLGADVEE